MSKKHFIALADTIREYRTMDYENYIVVTQDTARKTHFQRVRLNVVDLVRFISHLQRRKVNEQLWTALIAPESSISEYSAHLEDTEFEFYFEEKPKS